ncbi:APC family permease [Xanthomonas oryzae pv. oryzae]|uniref:APC family permease n=1 Tax=Xanthomonas oryzae TaxID=347 RepID=UPI000949F563|nr:APC family permease [Xanthomonas oryzae]OLH38006.1 amino acid transporter [Xanthomonas oryzae pv. oryzae]OLI43308.1 amino acid transporter [Xanthomonas oryzae pv. oryzae]OLI96329.1 amino acid transporter [Xanthomonas oryzae pv. oryzae]QBN85862.1 APC family permease [Xanthomonas oryzae pv. oryzae]RBA90863.1 APC family permease [Xanthomonas oryzae pv. oryzae]
MSEHALRRDVGPFALMLTGLGSIIGSGWLFGAWRAAGLAGPDAVWAWVLGAAIITTIAVSYAELGAMFPESGGMVRYSHYSHGSLVGFIAGWANWIAIVSVIPVEAEASVQYMASWPWAWAQGLYAQAPGGAGELSVPGLLISAVLVLVYFLLNFWSVKLFARSNTLITVFKLAVPAATGVALIASGFHSENFSVGVHGDAQVLDLAAVLTAVATAGIVFSFNGFQSPVNLAGEARNPGRSIPFAVLGSIALATVVYVILQVAYIGAVPPDLLAKAGWHGIDFRSPFAELAIIVNLQWLAMLLYIDAFVSPSGTGITYTATTARMVYGMEKNGTMPAALGKLHPVWGVPRMAMFFNLAVSFVFLFFFRGWGTLAAVISVATIISYLTGPISAMALRRHAPELHRPLRIAALPLLAGVAFVMATELLYWARWPLTGEIILLIVVALPVYCYYQARQGWPDLRRNLKGAAWMICYLPMIALLSWAGSSKFGGHGYLSYGTDLAMVAAVGVVFYIWGVRSGWRTPSVEKPVAQA